MVGISGPGWGCRLAAAFFKEMIIRVAIIGMNLMGSMSISSIGCRVSEEHLTQYFHCPRETKRIISLARLLPGTHQCDLHHSDTRDKWLRKEIQRSTGVGLE